ncbi:MAG: DUF2971 domain-containing protein [Clostridia bacterium]|nr:DUF2971 domain-containing protein [Clostridia bacterium]
MASVEEKLAFIQSIPNAVKNMKNAQNVLHALLMSDTNNGKLYKYRTVNNKNLRCFVDGTMYCASPDSFNDPFDCKIGYTFKGLYDAKYGTELDRLGKVLEKYIAVLDGRISILDCSDSERPVIEKLLNNERLSAFFKSSCNVAKTPEEVTRLIKNNAFVLTDLLAPLMENPEFAPHLGIIESWMPRLIQSIQPDGVMKISEDTSTFDDFAAANGITDDTDEIGKVLLISRKFAPDKEKEAASVQKTLKNGDEQIEKRMKEQFRIGCLVTDYKNRLMWSHYADAHKGFCIEYDFSDTDSYTLEHLPLPIVYSTDRPQIPWKAVIKKTPENFDEAKKQILVGLLTKDKAWEYENEWRIMLQASDDQFFKMPPITCIYLGACMNNHNRSLILNKAKTKGIPVKQMTLDRGAFDLHADNI